MITRRKLLFAAPVVMAVGILLDVIGLRQEAKATQMNIFDHLLRFDNENSAKAVIGKYYASSDSDYEGGWRGDVTIPDVSVYVEAADGTRTPVPGWFLVIALPTISFELRDLPNAACRLIADREAAAAGKVFLRYLAPDIDSAILSVAHIEPTFAGSAYPFGVSP
jgi:hypothetical protein